MNVFRRLRGDAVLSTTRVLEGVVVWSALMRAPASLAYDRIFFLNGLLCDACAFAKPQATRLSFDVATGCA